jgi:uncharacterized protein
MRIALALGVCLIAFAATAAAARHKVESKPEAKDPTPAPSARESYRSRLNENAVTIVAGSLSGTDLSIAYDIAQVLDDGYNLRVLPMVGKGAAQNVKDVMFLRGVDMGITQANILRYFARTGELGPNFNSQIAYVAKLFNEEIQILVRPDLGDIHQLEGQVVNFGQEGSGTEITAHLIFEAFGINVQEVHVGDADAIEKLKAREIDATIIMAGKPAPILASLKDARGLKLLPIPYTKELENDYYPATLTHDDYPDLIADGQNVDTVAVCAVLVTFNWTDDSDRYRRIASFVDAFFSHFDAFQKPPRHPKWREVNFAATLEGWHRSPLAQKWIDHAKETAESTSMSNFETFLAQTSQPTETPNSDVERAKLFRAFIDWNKSRPIADKLQPR